MKEVEKGHFCACHLYNDAEANAKASEEMAKARASEIEPVKAEIEL